MKSLSLRLPNSLASKLSAAARKRRASKSVVVREALEAYLSNPFSLHGGPGDLSHNPKHMEGFGQ